MQMIVYRQISLFAYMLMRDASLKQRIPRIICISIFGAFSAEKRAHYTRVNTLLKVHGRRSVTGLLVNHSLSNTLGFCILLLHPLFFTKNNEEKTNQQLIDGHCNLVEGKSCLNHCNGLNH